MKSMMLEYMMNSSRLFLDSSTGNQSSAHRKRQKENFNEMTDMIFDNKDDSFYEIYLLYLLQNELYFIDVGFIFTVNASSIL